ncbi:DUF3566 domain-containing protein [Corynebacterium urogenitale]
MAFHSPGNGHQSKDGSNPYSKDGEAGSAAGQAKAPGATEGKNTAGAGKAPRPGQKPAAGKKGKKKRKKGQKQQGAAQQSVAQQGQKQQNLQQQSQPAAQQPQQSPQTEKQPQQATPSTPSNATGSGSATMDGVAAGEAPANATAGAPGEVAGDGKELASSVENKDADKTVDQDADKPANSRKFGWGFGSRDERVYEERSITHIDPISALKVGFLMSAALFAVWLVAALVIYIGLAIAGVWDKLNGLIGDLTGTGEFGFGTYFGAVFALGLLELVVLTLLAPVAAVAYNASAQLLGGLRVKLDN